MPSASFPPNPRFLFNQIQRCSPRSWHKLPPPAAAQAECLVVVIRSLACARRLSAALAAFSSLRHCLSHPASPHLYHPISSLLAATAALRSLSHGSWLHGLAFSVGLLPVNPFIVSRLVAFYAACGLLNDAGAAVQDLKVNIAFPWNLLISAYHRNGSWKDAIFSYRMMLDREIMPDKFTISTVLSASAELRELGFGKIVHLQILARALESDLFVYNALIAMYVKCEAVDDARKVFDEMPERDVVSWNSMILGYTSEGRWEEISELLVRMQLEGFELNAVSTNTIICGHVHLGNYTEALRLISQTISRTNTFSVDSVSLLLGLKSCSELGYLNQGKEIHCLILRSDCYRFENIRNALITMYSKCHNINYAHILFQISSARSVVTWNAMISALASTNSFDETTSILREMTVDKTQPNHITLVTLLPLCADAADMRHGKELHCYAIRHGFDHYHPISNSLVNMYSMSGSISLAQRVFNMMECYDKISYTALIAGYALQREGLVASRLFHEMISRGIEPDKITIYSILSAWKRSKFLGVGSFV